MKASNPFDASAQAGGHAMLTLDDLCSACAVPSEFVLAMLEEGAAEPVEGQTPDSWRFTEVHVHHVAVAWRLQRDLGVNPAGAALALQLLEEIQTLRAQFSALDKED